MCSWDFSPGPSRNWAPNLETIILFAALFLIFIFVFKKVLYYVFIGAPKFFFLARAPKFLKTALFVTFLYAYPH